MKHNVKRLAGLLLVLAILLSFAVPMASAKDTLNELQTAVCETAMAYYYRGGAVDYDSVLLTSQGKYEGDGGDLRETDFTSPEDATMNNRMFSVCSAYTFEVYYDAFGYQMLDDPLTNKTANLAALDASNPIVAYKWDKEQNPDKSRADALEEAHALLQPGDWIVGILDTSGHAMLYIGDYFKEGVPAVIHCNGIKYSMETGKDTVDDGGKTANGGAIRIDPVDTFLFCENPSYKINTASKFVILRPLNVLKASDMTNNAKGRLQYKGLNINRVADHDKHRDVEQGGEITVTIEIQNNSLELNNAMEKLAAATDEKVKAELTAKVNTLKTQGAYKGLPVTEVIPAGAALKAGSIVGGGTESGGKITWNLDIAPGETKTIGYTVTATGKRGDTIKLEGGTVGTIRSNSIPVRIGGKHITDEQAKKLADIKSYRSAVEGGDLYGATFVNAVYQNALGIDPELPTPANTLKTAYSKEEVVGSSNQMYIPLTAEQMPASFKTQAAMMIPYYFGGTLVKTPNGHGKTRLMDLESFHLYPGDVVFAGSSIFSGKKADLHAYIMLGDNKAITQSDGKVEIVNADKALEKNLMYDYFVGFRPTLAYDDLTTERKFTPSVKLPFTDVKEGDWYYEFVKELYEKGIVNGMTDTTFVPNGKLTYGQALKLIVCGLGKGEQATTGSHWASGYLTFAKNQKWLDKDVDLNGPISRLAFCQIAAKAKNLTAQPASNPFKDCADKDVLALVNAGIINGMSADTFAPDNTLTRAQISKIISGLIK